MLANLRPSGKYLMEDFFYAGGLRAFLAQLGDLIDLSQKTCSGHTLGADIAQAKVYNDDVIRPRSNPLVANAGLAVLTGNLAPGGAVIKPAAMEPHLRKHRGPAVVFKDYNDMAARIDDPALEVTKDSVIVLQSAGPQGAPGMPEWGQLPIPKKLLKQGVRDMLRISDARMSGTSYGACVLHVTPESHVGGPLGLVRDGDLIELDVDARSINMLVSDEELARRKAAWQEPPPKFTRGYGVLYLKHVQQADTGCDFDFLETEKAKLPTAANPRSIDRPPSSTQRYPSMNHALNRRQLLAALGSAGLAGAAPRALPRTPPGPPSPSTTSCRSRRAAPPT